MTDQTQPAPSPLRLEKFEPMKRLLLGPGPSPVEDRVLDAMRAPLLGHLDPLFLKCMDDIQALLRYVFETENRLTIPVSGTGSAGMEAAIVNCIEPGDEVVVCIIGVFGERMRDMIERAGGLPVEVRAEWGKSIDRDRIEEALKSCRPRALALVHAETSTGVLQDLTGIGSLAHNEGALLIVDAVTSLGGHPVGVDRNRIDVCYSGTQKCLGAPPGLAPITFSDRALARIRARKSRVQSWYFDITMVERYWGEDRTYHHTAPISMNYALREALRIVYEEGLESRWKRHRLNHLALVAGLEAMGLEMNVAPDNRLWSLNAVKVPEGVDDARVRSRLLEDFNIEIGGGLGPLKGRIWRIGLMGSGSTRDNVLTVLDCLRRALEAEGLQLPSGAEAAERVYQGAGIDNDNVGEEGS
ncbi:MAG TPA: alanine--glyoxylate aminotransferase family protein [Blastocatellia bacterium]|nr:alanine--glyoxylate aminotransferase family protein [Blastocatellia bacterium]